MPHCDRRPRASGRDHVARDACATPARPSLIDPQTLDAHQEPASAGPGRRRRVHQGHSSQSLSRVLGRVQRISRVQSPGDDPRYLDWRLFARSDRYYVKRFEDETNLRCHLVARHQPVDGLSLGAVQQDRLRPHGGGHDRLFPDHAARRRGPAHVRGPDHRLPAAAASAGASPAADGDAGARAGRQARPTWPDRSNRSPRRSASAG